MTASLRAYSDRRRRDPVAVRHQPRVPDGQRRAGPGRVDARSRPGGGRRHGLRQFGLRRVRRPPRQRAAGIRTGVTHAVPKILRVGILVWSDGRSMDSTRRMPSVARSSRRCRGASHGGVRSRRRPAADCRRPSARTWRRSVYAKCVSCHRPGEVAPMSLITFRDVRPWAAAIREKVVSRTMPPWHADRAARQIPQRPRASRSARSTRSSRWVDAGAREGDPAAMPALPAFAEGWQIGTPDQVFEMRSRLPDPGARHDRLPVLRGADQLHRGPMDAGGRGACGRPRPRPPHHRLREGAAAASASSGRERPADPRPTAAGRPRRRARAGAGARGQRVPARRSRTGDSMLVNWAVGEDAPVFCRAWRSGFPQARRSSSRCTTRPTAHPARDRSKVGLIFAKEPPRRGSPDRR